MALVLLALAWPAVSQPTDTITARITPKRTQFGAIYGAEARDSASGTLLATAEQVALEGDLLVVEETQYSAAGTIVYKGKLFYSPARELIKMERIEGNRKWQLFRTWISDRP